MHASLRPDPQCCAGCLQVAFYCSCACKPVFNSVANKIVGVDEKNKNKQKQSKVRKITKDDRIDGWVDGEKAN